MKTTFFALTLLAAAPLGLMTSSQAASTQKSNGHQCACCEGECHCAAHQPKTDAKKPAAALRLTAGMTQRVLYRGQPLKVQVTAFNATQKPQTLQFRDSRRVDFSLVPQGQSDAVYTWSANKLFAQVLGRATLGAGQSRTFSAQMGADETASLKPGNYWVRARLASGQSVPPFLLSVKDEVLSMVTRVGKTRYKIGEPVEISMAVKNNSSQPVTVRFNSGQTFDYSIVDDAGKQVWQYSATMRFAQALRDVTWKAGETKTFRATWNGETLLAEDAGKLRPAMYKVTATLVSQPPLQAAPVAFYLVN